MPSRDPREDKFVADKQFLEKELKEIHRIKLRSGFISAAQLARAKQIVELIKNLEQRHRGYAQKHGFAFSGLLDVRMLSA